MGIEWGEGPINIIVEGTTIDKQLVLTINNSLEFRALRAANEKYWFSQFNYERPTLITESNKWVGDPKPRLLEYFIDYLKIETIKMEREINRLQSNLEKSKTLIDEAELSMVKT